MWEPNIPCFHCVPIDFRASDTFALTQTDETARAAYAAYATTNRAALQAERDRLYATVGRLASDLSAERLVVAQRRPDTARTAVLADRAERPASGTAVASFPGFDFSRLANPDLVRRRVDEAEYPDWAAQGGIEGDVLVLFQTDASGRVIRAAVATPIGGGLDALAENLVRDMVFVAPVVNGLATGLRSQVLVRFSRS